jgi:hypothetical protein
MGLFTFESLKQLRDTKVSKAEEVPTAEPAAPTVATETVKARTIPRSQKTFRIPTVSNKKTSTGGKIKVPVPTPVQAFQFPTRTLLLPALAGLHY